MLNQRHRILLLGNSGQLGWELNRCLATVGALKAFDYPQIDFLKLETVQRVVKEHKPHIIVNAAALTAVDKAEEQPQIASRINGTAPGELAELSKKNNALLVHYSTEYVFDGSLGRPYNEADDPNPLSAYGKSKLAGEQAVLQVGGNYLIMRTSWMYSLRRSNFFKKVISWARANEVLKVVNDQIGNPTSARMLAELTAQVLVLGTEDLQDWGEKIRGIYHCAGDGYTSRFDFAREILSGDPHQDKHVYKEMIPVSSDEFPTPARRPLFAALDCTKFKRTFGLSLPDWQFALKLLMEEIPR